MNAKVKYRKFEPSHKCAIILLYGHILMNMESAHFLNALSGMDSMSAFHLKQCNMQNPQIQLIYIGKGTLKPIIIV